MEFSYTYMYMYVYVFILISVSASMSVSIPSLPIIRAEIPFQKKGIYKRSRRDSFVIAAARTNRTSTRVYLKYEICYSECMARLSRYIHTYSLYTHIHTYAGKSRPMTKKERDRSRWMLCTPCASNIKSTLSWSGVPMAIHASVQIQTANLSLILD